MLLRKKSQITFLFLLLSVANFLSAFHSSEFLILRSFDCGLFAMFHTVLGLLDAYEHKECQGFKVDFADTGLYYEPAKGLNWWEYYFEPINVGNAASIKDLNQWEPEVAPLSHRGLCLISRKRGNELIRKYIRLKPYLHAHISDLKEKLFGNYFIVGVHYRGTNKAIEIQGAQLLEYETAYKKINEILTQVPSRHKIFVATDEQRFLDFMQSKFGDKIVFVEQPRSKKGETLYINAPANFNYSKVQLGVECITDAILLSQTHVLLKTASFVSSASLLFNPKLRVIHLNKHIFGEYLNSL